MAVHLSAHGRRRRQRLLLEVFALLIVVRIRGLVFWLGNPRQVHLSTATTPTHASVVVVLHEFLSRLLFGHLLDPSAFPCVWWPTMTRLKVTPQFCFKRLIINLGILLLAFIDLIDIDGPASKRPVLDDFARHLSRGLFERARRRRARPAKRGALGAARAAAHQIVSSVKSLLTVSSTMCFLCIVCHHIISCENFSAPVTSSAGSRICWDCSSKPSGPYISQWCFAKTKLC